MLKLGNSSGCHDFLPEVLAHQSQLASLPALKLKFEHVHVPMLYIYQMSEAAAFQSFMRVLP